MIIYGCIGRKSSFFLSFLLVSSYIYCYIYLIVVELSGEVPSDGLDDVPHGERARAEHGPDGVPVSLQMSPGEECPSGIVCHGAEHSAHILTSHLALVQSHPQVTGSNKLCQTKEFTYMYTHCTFLDQSDYCQTHL